MWEDLLKYFIDGEAWMHGEDGETEARNAERGEPSRRGQTGLDVEMLRPSYEGEWLEWLLYARIYPQNRLSGTMPLIFLQHEVDLELAPREWRPPIHGIKGIFSAMTWESLILRSVQIS